MWGESFYDAEKRSHAGIQGEFSSRWRVRPMRAKENFSPEPDLTRAVYELDGIFQWSARDMMLGMEEAGFSSRNPKLTIMRCQLQSSVNQNDLFEFVCGGGADLAPGEAFQVTDVKPDGVSGIEFSLVQMGLQSGASP